MRLELPPPWNVGRNAKLRYRTLHNVIGAGDDECLGALTGSVAAVSHTLTTPRLILRPATASDHADLLSHGTAPDVRRFVFDG